MSQHQGHPLNTSTLLELASVRILIFLPSLDSLSGRGGGGGEDEPQEVIDRQVVKGLCSRLKSFNFMVGLCLNQHVCFFFFVLIDHKCRICPLKSGNIVE